MLNFKNISPSADFYSKLDLLLTRLEILNKNLLYCTHMEDKILKLLKTISIDDSLQKQVDDFVIPDAPLEDMAQDGNSSSN